ncbi:hypothetical protein [Chamaesiphon minutus]|nr:hypothetical protein [Chamaesiphon minutus]
MSAFISIYIKALPILDTIFYFDRQLYIPTPRSQLLAPNSHLHHDY